MKGKRNIWAAFALHFFCGLALAGIIREHFSSQLWWLGILIWAIFTQAWLVDFWRPLMLWRSLGHARINLNLDAARASAPESSQQQELSPALLFWRRTQLPPFVFRLTYLVLPLTVVLAPPATAEIKDWGSRIQSALRPATLEVAIEPPAYALQTPIHQSLRRDSSVQIAVVSGSLIELRTLGGEGLEALRHKSGMAQDKPKQTATELEVSAESPAETATTPQPAKPSYKSTFSANGTWSGSTDLLAEKLGLERTLGHELTLNVKAATGHEFKVTLTISPSPLPHVSLALSGKTENPGQPGVDETNDPASQTLATSAPITQEQGEISFHVKVDSETPLTQVELMVRTESGYAFTMPVGEFTGTGRLDFEAPQVRLQTVGIPFAEKDFLYVKARAQTFVKDIVGFSTELKFPVKSPLEIRKELAAQLEKIREQLKQRPNPKDGFSDWKNKLNSALEATSQASVQLGRQSQPSRNIEQARQLAQSMDAATDKQVHPIDARIRDAIEALKRQQAQEEASSWFMKMGSFLDKLSASNLDDSKARSELNSAAQNLGSEAETMKEAIRKMVEGPKNGLKLEEKQIALELLERDQTPARTKEMAETIEGGQKEQATAQGRQTLEAANKNLGGILQLMAVARARLMKDARDKLTKADESLEDSRRSNDKSQQSKNAQQAQKDLDDTPQLGESFNEALANAQDGSKALRQAIQQDSAEGARRELDKTQRSIADALAALQEEEQSSRDERNQEEGRRFRSAMDAMNAQGQLDSGWRKKIFEEISRLREQGVPADAEIIRYLESRLR
jgi:hypothetical protein